MSEFFEETDAEKLASAAQIVEAYATGQFVALGGELLPNGSVAIMRSDLDFVLEVLRLVGKHAEA